MISDPTDRIARRLLAERETRGWSQGDLAARAGVSKAMISKIERGEASPTAALLARLSGAFELTLATLLARAENEGGRLTRAADQAIWQDPETRYVRRQLYARPGGPIELVQVSLPPGAEVAIPAAAYTFIRQVVWVMDGDLEIREGGVIHQLTAGDCLEFGEPADCAYRNPGTRPASYVVAVTAR